MSISSIGKLKGHVPTHLLVTVGLFQVPADLDLSGVPGHVIESGASPTVSSGRMKSGTVDERNPFARCEASHAGFHGSVD